ncbi:CapA family protein, partial [candidate division KSB1 bacterium]
IPVEANKNPVVLGVESKTDTLLTIVGVGDIMLGTNYPSKIYLPPNNQCLLDPVDSFLIQADVTFGNLEGTILSRGGTPKGCRDPSKCYVFRMPNRYINCLVSAGFDFLSLANNHSGDFGSIGRNNTMRLLDSTGIKYAGLISHPVSVFEKDGIKYGFCAFAPNSGTCDIRNIPKAQQMVRDLDEKCDIIIVSFHGGAEGAKYQHVTRSGEKFYGENRGNVYDFAHKMIDAGADMVFGHGPHVTRAIDIYKDRFIIYSLGNFCTYHRFNLSGPNGLAPIIELKVDKDGSFVKGKIIPTYQQGEGGPLIDPQKRVITKLQELTAADFPEVGVKIDDEGNITY